MGWVKTQSGQNGWRDYAAALRRGEEAAVRQAAHHAATEQVVVPVQEAILSNPVTNGAVSPDLDFTSVVPEIQTWEDEANVYVGIPTDNPASDKAHQMEYGDDVQPPTPVLRGTYDFAREDAQKMFEDHLRGVMEQS